jgi:hypothetical protein
MEPAAILPNFFIAGAPKSGTTALYHYLDQHPQIYMSPLKEPNYFAPEIRLERFSERLRPRAEEGARKLRAYLEGPMREKRFGGLVTEWHDYLKLFQQADGQKAVGEASVCYLWSVEAAARIRETVPDARIILILRNPVEVAFSLYLHGLRSGAPHCTFREAIQMGLEQRGGPIDVMHPFLDLGLYSEQVQRFMTSFPEAQMRSYFYDDYEKHPLRMLPDIFRFLDVDPAFRPDMSKRYLEGRNAGIPFDPDDRAWLVEFYKEDIGRLSNLLKRDLSGWLAV